MAKKSFEKKDFYKSAALYGVQRFNEGSKKTVDSVKQENYEELYLEALKQAEIYKTMSTYREGQYQLARTKYIVTFVIMLIEAVVIWILA